MATGVKAATVNVSVDSHSGPWLWNNSTLNTTYQYGINDQIVPSVIDSSSGLSFVAGNTLTITYLSGLTNAFAGTPEVDALGYTNLVTNGNGGSTGLGFPSQDTPADWDTYLNQLFGTFADATGTIVSNPFAVGLGRTVTIPVGATRLQLGLNDYIFSDNTGSLEIQVQGQGTEPPTAVPETQPLTILSVITLLGLGVGLKRKLR